MKFSYKPEGLNALQGPKGFTTFADSVMCLYNYVP